MKEIIYTKQADGTLSIKTIDVAERVPSEEELQAQKLAEIEALQEELAKLDYKTIKRMQGKLSDAEWEETCDVCDNLRKRINQLESEIAESEVGDDTKE